MTFDIFRWPRLEFEILMILRKYYLGSVLEIQKILRKLLSAMEKEKSGILHTCTTSKPAHSSEILYDKCFFEYITTTFVTF